MQLFGDPIRCMHCTSLESCLLCCSNAANHEHLGFAFSPVRQVQYIVWVWTTRWTGIDPDSRPLWVEKPVTLWTWLNIPASITLEDGKSAVGEQFGRLLCAPDGFVFSHTRRRSFHLYGRKALSWGRVQEKPDVFCIITRMFASCNWST